CASRVRNRYSSAGGPRRTQDRKKRAITPPKQAHRRTPARTTEESMSRTLVVCGHGPGISDAVARRFGKKGFSVAIVAPSADRLTEAAATLNQTGIRAAPFSCDLGDTKQVVSMLSRVRTELGKITVLHWNATAHGAGDLTTASTDDLRVVFDVNVHGLVAA